MQRRNLLIGMGSLAAGGAATIGTGAFTTAEASREVSVSITSDENSFMSFKTSSGEFTNAQYAEVADGKLEFTLGSEAISGSDQENRFGVTGEGLNPDSTYYIDDVFGCYNGGSDQIKFEIDWSGLDNSSNFEFYWLPAGIDYTDSRPDSIGGSDYTETTGGCPSGSFERIGIAIKTPANGTNSSWETGSVDISAYDKSEVNEPVTSQ